MLICSWLISVPDRWSPEVKKTNERNPSFRPQRNKTPRIRTKAAQRSGAVLVAKDTDDTCGTRAIMLGTRRFEVGAPTSMLCPSRRKSCSRLHDDRGIKKEEDDDENEEEKNKKERNKKNKKKKW